MTTKSQPTARRERGREPPPPFRLPLSNIPCSTSPIRHPLFNTPYLTPLSDTRHPTRKDNEDTEEENEPNEGEKKGRIGSTSTQTTTTTEERIRASNSSHKREELT
jgi:hypothetical protein